jgi:hypothetical protein
MAAVLTIEKSSANDIGISNLAVTRWSMVSYLGNVKIAIADNLVADKIILTGAGGTVKQQR